MALFDGEVALFLSHDRPPSLGAGASHDMSEQHQALWEVGMVRWSHLCTGKGDEKCCLCRSESTTWPWSNQPVAILLVLRDENRI